MTNRILCEVCVESAAGAIASRQSGADRVELCANLVEGGTTPSTGTVRVVRRATEGGLFVMIRPRGGDFLYSETELLTMEHDIDAMKAEGVDGVVFGLLTPDGTVDVERTARLTKRARPLGVTFHRAFDMTRDPHAALEALIELGVDRVLTSGQRDSVADGIELVGELVERAGDRIAVMPGAGATPENVRAIVDGTGAREVHVFAGKVQDSAMQFRNPGCTMGAPIARGEYELCETDAAGVAAFLRALS